jgi:4-hydroxy-3-polyprenylbenzoate decarboxylase
MEQARMLWERLGLPPLAPEAPWHGYSLGDWPEESETVARRAVEGRYLETGQLAHQRRRRDVMPNTSTRDAGEH